MSCRRLKKAGSNDIYGDAKTQSYMLMDSAVATPTAKAGGAKRGRKAIGGNLLNDAVASLQNVQNAVANLNSTSTPPPTGGCASANCRRTKKQGGNMVDLAPFAVALSLIGVRMLKDKKFMNKVDDVINSPSSQRTKSTRSRKSD